MMTEILTIKDESEAQSILKAARMLDAGKLVAFPTETVYGIGCQAEPKAIERLSEIKKRRPEKHYTLHIGNMEQLEKYVPQMDARARKLVKKALPGPLTIVFELDDSVLSLIKKQISPGAYSMLYSDGSIGIRWPDHAVACGILSQAQAPIVAPSANPADCPPAINAAEVKHYFNGQIDCIVEVTDYGQLYNKSSTVVKVGKGKIEILRAGAVGAEKVRELSTIWSVFVCTGNTCRSPMAEGYARKYFADKMHCSVDELQDFGYKFSSVGIAAFEGAPASAEAVEVCQVQGIELLNHRSSPVHTIDIDKVDFLFTMSRSHWMTIIEYWPRAKEKCFLLDEDGDISDPIGLGRDVYTRCLEQIKNAIQKRAQELL